MDPDDLDALDAPDAALAAAVTTGDDREAPFTLDGLAEVVGTTRTLLDAVARAGLLLPHHIDEDGVARYSQADVAAVRAGLEILDAGLPLAELLGIARHTDAAIATVAHHAVESFLRFVRDPVRGTISDDAEAAARLVTAYERMLPATERLVAHHTRRRLVAEALERVAEEVAKGAAGRSPGAGEDAGSDDGSRGAR